MNNFKEASYVDVAFARISQQPQAGICKPFSSLSLSSLYVAGSILPIVA
jgi:hypothetical protein